MELEKIEDRTVNDECKYYLIRFNDELGDSKLWSMVHSEEKANEEFDFIIDNYNYPRVWIEEMKKVETKKYKVLRVDTSI